MEAKWSYRPDEVEEIMRAAFEEGFRRGYVKGEYRAARANPRNPEVVYGNSYEDDLHDALESSTYAAMSHARRGGHDGEGSDG